MRELEDLKKTAAHYIVRLKDDRERLLAKHKTELSLIDTEIQRAENIYWAIDNAKEIKFESEKIDILVAPIGELSEEEKEKLQKRLDDISKSIK